MPDEPTNTSTVAEPAPPAPSAAEPSTNPAPLPIGSVDAATESLLSSVRVLTPQNASAATNKAEQAEPKEDPKGEGKTEPKPEPKPEPSAEPQLSPKAHEKFTKIEARAAKAESERDAASKERDELRAQLEQASNSVREMELLKQRAEKAERTASEYQTQLRVASLERDPEFKARFDGGVESHRSELRQLAIASGATEQQFTAALESGDEEALQLMRESLKPAQQRQWDVHFTDIERLNFARKEALQNSDRTWEQLEAQRAEQIKAQTERVKQENVRIADSTVETLWNEIPGLKDSQPEVRAQIENVLKDAVANWPREQLVRELAIGQIRAQVIGAQKSVMDQNAADIEARDKEIADLKAKVAEQETFIKEHAASYPRAEVRGGNSNGNGATGSLLESVRVHLPGQ